MTAKIMSTTAITVASCFIGKPDIFFRVLCIMLVLDFLTGIMKALKTGTYRSNTFKIGLFKTTGYFISLVAVEQLDIMCKANGMFRNVMISFIVGNEGLSIVENLGVLGVKFPNVITNALANLRTHTSNIDK
ncbi:holin family protein [Clostridium sp.]|uniref:phage holin family protein n=1 Tax=Clostridium sp. TaxID=1506 RepID=UPI003992E9FD